jgi:hypothetical protein
LRVTELRDGPSQNLLEQAESVFKIEAAQERLPQPVHLISGCARAREPQLYGLGVAVAGQVIYRQPDQGSLDDRQRAVVIEPGGAMGEPCGVSKLGYQR